LCGQCFSSIFLISSGEASRNTLKECSGSFILTSKLGSTSSPESVSYFGAKHTLPSKPKRLKADIAKNGQTLALSMDDHEEVDDEFEGVKLWWASGKDISKSPTYYNPEEKRYYRLTFHKRHRDLILQSYLTHVLKEGKAMEVRNRQRKLYTNSASNWSHVVLKHPASFQTRPHRIQQGGRVLRKSREGLEARLSPLWPPRNRQVHHDCCHGQSFGL